MRVTRRTMIAASGTAIAFAPWAFARAADDKPKRKVLMFTKSAGFEHSVIRRDGERLAHAESIFKELAEKNGIEVVITKDGRVFDGDLDQFDAFFFYTTGDLTTEGTDGQPAMSADGKQRLLKAVAEGKGFLASHCGADTFHSAGAPREAQNELDPYIAMLGGEFISHGPQQEARQAVISADFPGCDSLGGELVLNDEWYSLKNYADDLHVILAQDTQGMEGRDYERPAFPSTWARRHEKGRVFYTSMGHREDVWTNPKFQTLLLGGLRWAMGDVEASVEPNMDKATPGARVMPPS